MFAALVGVGLLLAGCGSSTSSSDGRRSVVAAFYPLAFAAEQVGGSSVRVRNLTPAGAEPHDLELTPGTVRAVADADVVLYLGHGFMPALEHALGERSGPSVDLLAGQALRPGLDAGGNSVQDPHVWLDPVRFAAIARTVGAALGHPEAGAALARRARALDAEFAHGLRVCARRDMVTSHAAFGYLAARYGLRQVPLEGLAPETEPSARDLAALVRKVRDSGATTVFFETLVSPKLAETVARESGAATAVLDPLEGLTASEAESGADYFSVMRQNLRALRKALACR